MGRQDCRTQKQSDENGSRVDLTERFLLNNKVGRNHTKHLLSTDKEQKEMGDLNTHKLTGHR